MAKHPDDMMETKSKIKLTTSDYVIRGIGYVMITLFAIASIFPFLIILGTSFETEDNIITSESFKCGSVANNFTFRCGFLPISFNQWNCREV